MGLFDRLFGGLFSRDNLRIGIQTFPEKEAIMPQSIIVNHRRIAAVQSAWHTHGKWMLVWDGNGYPRLRKVYCVLPEVLGVPYPVYSLCIGGTYGHACWLHAGEIPEGLDVSGVEGWDDMKKDLKQGAL